MSTSNDNSNEPIFGSKGKPTKRWGKLGLRAGFIALGASGIGLLALLLSGRGIEVLIFGFFVTVPMVVIAFGASLAGFVMSIIGARTGSSTKNEVSFGIILNAITLVVMFIFGLPFVRIMVPMPSSPNDYLYGMDFSPDGKSLATAWTKEIRVLDAETGRLVQRFKGHKADVTFVAYSPDGKILASTSIDKTVRLWDVNTAKELLSFTAEDDISGLSFSPDGSRLLVVSRQKGVIIFNTHTYEQLKMIPEFGNQVNFSPDRSHIGFNKDSNIYITNTTDFRDPISLSQSLINNTVDQFAMSPNIKLVALSLQDLNNEKPGELQIWELAGNKLIYSSPLSYSYEQVLSGYSVTLAFSPDNKKLAYTADNYFNILDVNTQEVVAFNTTDDNKRFPVSTIIFSPDGTRVAISITDYAMMWDTKNHNLLWQYPR